MKTYNELLVDDRILEAARLPVPEEDRELYKEAEAFSEMMTRTPTFARLAEQCGYFRYFNGADRDAVLAIALELAWTRRDEVDPARISLNAWWDSCLRLALGTREKWQCHYRDFSRYETVPDIIAMKYEDWL